MKINLFYTALSNHKILKYIKDFLINNKNI